MGFLETNVGFLPCFIQFIQLDKTVCHSKSDRSGTIGGCSKGFFVISQGSSVILLVESDAGFPQQRWDVVWSLT